MSDKNLESVPRSKNRMEDEHALKIREKFEGMRKAYLEKIEEVTGVIAGM